MLFGAGFSTPSLHSQDQQSGTEQYRLHSILVSLLLIQHVFFKREIR